MKNFLILAAALSLVTTAHAQTFDYKTSGTDFILYNVSVPQQNESIAFAGGSQYTVESAPGVIIKTTDGGETWESVYSGDNIQSVEFVTPQKGFAGGYSPLLKMTEDGGESWQDVNVGNDVYGIRIIKFFNENTGLVLYITDEYDLVIKTTSDGGQTWNLSSNPPQHGIMQISYADETTIFAVGYSSSVYKSIDGGDNWTLVDSNGTDINLGVNFKDSQNGVYAGEEGDLYVTHDGGETWENTLYTGYHHFYGLKYKGDKILAAGTDEDVYLSVDNGENFEMIFNGSGDDQLYDISFFADNSGLICGSGGMMIKFSGIVLSTNENIQSQSVIYPNPAKDVLNVKNKSAIDQIVISDITGKTVYSQKNLNSEVQIDLNGLSKGVYMIKINSGGSINTHKFSKK
ncbi:MAG: T9SS type A sorting domain-containing protein [Weeksellaceae bacterium]